MKKLTCILFTLILLLNLTACGGSSSNSSYKLQAAEEAAPMEAPAAMAMGAAMDTANSVLETGTTASSVNDANVPDSRKWIITADMNVETDDLEVLMKNLTERIEALNGYVEDQNIYNGSTHASRRYRNANLTVRIPAEQVYTFTEEVGGIANVVSNNLRREDVTLQYVDTEGRVNALKTEETRLLELLAGAETMSDLLEIEARLSDVRYELESYTSRLRTLDNQINYSTVYLFIEEVQEYTPVEEPTLWERITNVLDNSLDGLIESLQDLLVFGIISLPYILVYGSAGLIIFLLIKKIRKRSREKKPSKKPNNSDQT